MIGQAFENIASMFAPPSAQEIAGYAQANKLRTENEGLEALMQLAGDPNADLNAFDRYGAATGMFNPNQGFGARDMADATQRYGYDTASADRRYNTDVTANTTLQTNRLDNQTRAIGDLFGPLSQGQVRPEVPDEFMQAIGLPGAAAVEGAPKPLSESEVEGALLQDAIGTGMLGPKDAADLYRGGINIEQVIGADIDGDGVGDPVNVARGDAIGRTPYNNPGSAPAPQTKNYRTPDGRTGTAVWEPGSRLLADAATGEPLPEGTITGDIADAGGGVFSSTTSNQTDATRLESEVNYYLGRVNAMRELLAQNPGIAGVPGTIRGFAQDAMAFVNEMATAYGPETPIRPEDVAEMAERFGASGNYDPAIRKFRALAIELAYARAKAADPSGEVNVREFEQHLSAFNGGLAGNQGVMPAVDALEDSLRSRLATQVQTLRHPGQDAPASNRGEFAQPAAPAARPRATNAQGDVIEWDGTAWVPVQ